VKAGAKAGTIRVRLLRSGIGFERNQKETIRSLGFKRLLEVRTLPDNPSIRGMIATVSHLVEIEPGEGKGTAS
jgi:large subunit ribosomal protein L30